MIMAVICTKALQQKDWRWRGQLHDLVKADGTREDIRWAGQISKYEVFVDFGPSSSQWEEGLRKRNHIGNPDSKSMPV